MGFMEKNFGDLNEKEVKRIGKIVDKVEALDEQMQALSDEELRGKTAEFRQRIADGEKREKVLEEYTGDENFESWFEEFSGNLRQIMNEK